MVQQRRTQSGFVARELCLDKVGYQRTHLDRRRDRNRVRHGGRVRNAAVRVHTRYGGYPHDLVADRGHAVVNDKVQRIVARIQQLERMTRFRFGEQERVPDRTRQCGVLNGSVPIEQVVHIGIGYGDFVRRCGRVQVHLGGVYRKRVHGIDAFRMVHRRSGQLEYG